MSKRFLLTLLAIAPGMSAHDIPADLTVQMYLKAEDGRARILVRIPVKALREIEFPLREDNSLVLERAEPFLRTAASVWIANSIDLFEEETRLGRLSVVRTRVSLPSDRSFDTYENAVRHLTGPPLDPSVHVTGDQAVLDVLLEAPVHSERSQLSIHPAFDRYGSAVLVVLKYLPPESASGQTVRAFEFLSDPGLVRLDPRWTQAAYRFMILGFWHILDGTDHLLFLVALTIPFRRFRSLIPIVTSFTVAHSVTLIASAYGAAPGAAWFPPLIEVLIAASIVYMALENIASTGTIKRRWLITFAFGLVHGFGFSFALRESLQFVGSHLLLSLVSFNVGIELGQLLVLIVLIPSLSLLFRYVVAERMGTIILSALVAHTGWHWMVERWGQLSRLTFGP